MSPRPKISILIPTFNYARFLPEAIESVLRQDYRDFEILVSDDASDDCSADILSYYADRDPRIRVMVQPRNLGMVANWNWCLAQARGEYVKFLFGDDRLGCVHALRGLARMLDDHQDAVLAASTRQLIDENSRPLGHRDDIAHEGVVDGKDVARRCLLQFKNCIGEPSTVMFRRAALAARPFSPHYRQAVDLEMWLFLLRGGNLVYTHEPLSQFRCHAQQQTAVNQRRQLGLSEHVRLAQDYWIDFLGTETALKLRERRELFELLHWVQRKQEYAAGMESQLPRLWQLLGPLWSRYFWVERKLTRPLANARRACLVHLRGRRATLPAQFSPPSGRNIPSPASPRPPFPPRPTSLRRDRVGAEADFG
jgi:glycosyltransferase involved in cell wall biosynthesis